MKKNRKIWARGTSLFLISIFILLFFNRHVFAYSDPSITITPDQTIADQFTRHTVTGITTPLPVSPDVPGFIGASYVTIGDINRDGIKEIICTSGVGEDANQNTANGAVAIFTWDGVNLDSWTKSVINNTFPFPNETIIRDMDGDGDHDIMVLDNFIAGWSTRFVAGIYYLENQNEEDITQPSNWVKRTIFQGAPDYPDGNLFSPIGKSSYHRAFFLDVDGDGKEDFITSKVCMEIWQNPEFGGWWWTDYPGLPDYPYPGPQYTWMEVFKKEDAGYVQNDADGAGWGGTSYGYSRHAIGDGGGFLFNIADVDRDGDLDILAPQFFIQQSGSLIAQSGFRGDSLCWFENPGASSAALNLWTRRTIDNQYTSPNSTGKGFEAVGSDIDNDGDIEIVFSSHNHQDYKPDGYPTPGKEYHRFWPAGVYYFEIPTNPQASSQWTPISFDTGDPNLDPTNATAVANDVYAVDRPGGPYSQGSPGTVRVDDMDDDGYPELVVPGDGKGALYYYESVGMLNYKRAALYKDRACMPGDAKIDDIDGDGDKDIIAVIYDTSYLKPPPATNKLKSSSVFVFEKEGHPPICGNGEIEAGEECETNQDCINIHGQGWGCSNCQCVQSTVIELISFEADAGWFRVTLKWETAAEIDNAGFNIYRSETADGEFVKLNTGLISAKGSATQGASYRFADWGTERGKTYYYKLEDVDIAGNATLHGPASAKPLFILGFLK